MRKAPAQEGRPGFIRVDDVHQVDPAGVKSVLHINAVDCVYPMGGDGTGFNPNA